MTTRSDKQNLLVFIEKSSLQEKIKTALLLPAIFVQGLWIRKKTPRLPEAEGPREGVSGNGPSLKILIAGDSSAAGVGVPTQSQALAGRLLANLVDTFRVQWTLIAQSGLTTAGLHSLLHDMSAAEYDIALTATGVNDVTSRRSIIDSLADKVKLVELIRRKFAIEHILISGLPPLHEFPSLPQPLRWYLGSRAKRLDTAARTWSLTQPDCEYINMNFSIGPEAIASDGFHPGPDIYSQWGLAAAQMIKKGGNPDR